MKDDPGTTNPLAEKTYSFARRSIKLYRHLVAEQREFVLSKQVLRCGTSIGANVAEANQAQSRPDFISKLSIALKEAVETKYWLRLLKDEYFIAAPQADALLGDCRETIKILTASIKTAKGRAS